MSLESAKHPKSAAPSHTRTACINLGSLGQISSLLWLDHTASPYAAYGPTPGVATQPSAYPLALAAIQTALEFLDPGCLQNSDFFRAPQTTTARQTALDSQALGTPAKDPTPPRPPRNPEALHQPAPGGTALTLSAPIAGAGNLILAAGNPSRATKPLAQAKAPTRPARQNVVVRHSWLRTATKSPAFALSSAAINGLMLVSPLVSLAQTTTYGDGGSSNIYPTPATINSGNTVILNNNATVDPAGSVTANGTLQFNQTTNLTIPNLLTGSGSLALINTGNLTLAYNTTISGPFGPNLENADIATINAFDLGISLTQGSLFVGADGGNGLAIGSVSNGTLSIAGGTVKNTDGYLGFGSGSNGTATVATGGTWTNTGNLTVGLLGNGNLAVSGGNVSNVNGVIGAEGGNYNNTIAGSNGIVTISGGNWTNSGNLTVGAYGNGTLTMSGGNISNFNSVIGDIGKSHYDINNWYGSNGIVTISGGNWTNSGSLTVGRDGIGTLTVSGGNVSSASASIGTDSTATISGGNWTNTGSLTVSNPNSKLTINGGLLTVGGDDL